MHQHRLLPVVMSPLLTSSCTHLLPPLTNLQLALSRCLFRLHERAAPAACAPMHNRAPSRMTGYIPCNTLKLNSPAALLQAAGKAGSKTAASSSSSKGPAASAAGASKLAQGLIGPAPLRPDGKQQRGGRTAACLPHCQRHATSAQLSQLRAAITASTHAGLKS